MKWLDNIKAERETKRLVIGAINWKITDLYTDDKSDVNAMVDLVEKKRKIKMNGVDVGDVVKVGANLAVVMVLVGFEMGNILNQKGSRFIKTL